MATKELLSAVIAGANALRENAAECEKDELFKADNSAAQMLRFGIERNYQHADLLEGWARRNGWNPDE